MQYWIAMWSSEKENSQDNKIYPEILLLLSTLVLITTFLRNLYLFKKCYSAVEKIHNSSFARILFAHNSFYDSIIEGKLLNIFSRDTFMMDNILIAGLTDSYMFILIILSYFLVIIYVIPYNFIVIVAYAVFVCFAHRKLAHKIRSLKRQDISSRNPIYGLFNEIIDGYQCLSIYSMVKSYRDRITDFTYQASRVTYNYIIVMRFYIVITAMTLGIVLGVNALLLVLILSKDDATYASLSLSFTSTIIAYLP